MEISSEGMILTSVRGVPVILRPEEGSVFGEITDIKEGSPKLFGAYDEKTGLRSAMAIRAGSVVYEYRETAIPVPEDPEERIRLAKQLLNGRELTKKERRTYDLELP